MRRMNDFETDHNHGNDLLLTIFPHLDHRDFIFHVGQYWQGYTQVILLSVFRSPIRSVGPLNWNETYLLLVLDGDV
jgi:hypothetical protein